MPVEQFTHGMERGRRPRPLLQLRAQFDIRGVGRGSRGWGIRQACVFHVCIPPRTTRVLVHTQGYATLPTKRQDPTKQGIGIANTRGRQLFWSGESAGASRTCRGRKDRPHADVHTFAQLIEP
ncbi:hypothetical protein STRTUCAR8_09516 [Streptomyces turgidiscabies Car8]|uniref:Uncharacterized protein n=1 Tax=Streptomyces turgidiscabies (strain Car8) TaxID=698760 RepID=L7F7Y6_STRT8|nr:hypothetical protein STRTUCAR8_09516 [Streptomyces turgidiscabies Car8]